MSEARMRGVSDPVRSKEQAAAELCPEVLTALRQMTDIADAYWPGESPFSAAIAKRISAARSLLSRMEGR